MDLDDLVRCFLFYEQNPMFIGNPPLSLCPTTDNVRKISVYHSATAVFCAPSNPSGTGSLYRETIRCTPRWKTGDIVAHRRDCVVLNTGVAPAVRCDSGTRARVLSSRLSTPGLSNLPSLLLYGSRRPTHVLVNPSVHHSSLYS